jgi:hypothetical protein
MKTFKDLEFKQHPLGNGKQATIFFNNGYGISVVRFSGGPFGGSYTSNDSEWEIAVIKKTNTGFELTYNTPITDDVLGHQSEEDVTNVMKQVQELK